MLLYIVVCTVCYIINIICCILILRFFIFNFSESYRYLFFLLPIQNRYSFHLLTPTLIFWHISHSLFHSHCIAGERYDFIINANQPVGAYWIQVRGLGECGIRRAQQLGILRYARGPYQPASAPPTYDVGIPQGVVSKWLIYVFVYIIFIIVSFVVLITKNEKEKP